MRVTFFMVWWRTTSTSVKFQTKTSYFYTTWCSCSLQNQKGEKALIGKLFLFYRYLSDLTLSWNQPQFKVTDWYKWVLFPYMPLLQSLNICFPFPLSLTEHWLHLGQEIKLHCPVTYNRNRQGEGGLCRSSKVLFLIKKIDNLMRVTRTGADLGQSRESCEGCKCYQDKKIFL